MYKNLKLYAYFNIKENPVTAWEVAIGRVAAARYNKKSQIPVSFWFFSLLQSCIKSKFKDSRLIKELQIELIRKQFFPSKVSRLKGVYFFSSLEEAKSTLNKWTNGNYNELYISQVNFNVKNISYYDSDWITYNLSKEHNNFDEWMFNYLAGKPMSNAPSWEIVADGIGLIVNNNLRELAYRELMKKWPDSSTLLALSSYAFYYNLLDAGRIVPSVLLDNETLTCCYLFDHEYMKEHQLEIAKSVERGEKEGIFFPCKPPKDHNTFFSLPDFRKIMPTFPISDPTLYEYFNKILKFMNQDD